MLLHMTEGLEQGEPARGGTVAAPPDMPEGSGRVATRELSWSIVAVILVPPMVSVAYAVIVNSLPRPMQGEAVSVPWSICFAGYWIVAVFMPWLLSRIYFVDSRKRTMFVIAIFVATLLLELSCGGSMWAEAWRREL